MGGYSYNYFLKYVTVNDFLDSLMRFAKEFNIYAGVRRSLYTNAHYSEKLISHYLTNTVTYAMHIGDILKVSGNPQDDCVLLGFWRDYAINECGYSDRTKITI